GVWWARTGRCCCGPRVAFTRSVLLRENRAWETYRRHYGPDGDPSSLQFNPTLPKRLVVNVEALMSLRDQVDKRLLEVRAELEKQLAALTQAKGTTTKGRASLKGRKVPPKYRGPSGETWSGRGARPRWLVAAIKDGKKLDDFLIDKSARKGRRKRRSKR